MAEGSPYFEAMAARDVEVLFAYESYDELVLINLQQFDKKNMRSIESELQSSSTKESNNVDINGMCLYKPKANMYVLVMA